MRNPFFLLIAVLGAFFCSREAHAQKFELPLNTNPAYDSACYFPQLGIPAEFDSIYGGVAYQHLGDKFRILPPLKQQSYDRLVMTGLPDNIPFLTAVETGPSFNLHALKESKKYPYIFDSWPAIKTGHFRSPKYTDILTGYGDEGGGSKIITIFWSDDNGEYDSSRYTILAPFAQFPGTGMGISDIVSPYVTRMTSDNLDDIMMSFYFHHPKLDTDTVYLALFRGGDHLYHQGKYAMWDDTAFWEYLRYMPLDSIHRSPLQADWRGVGREDLIAYDYLGNFYYFKNDPPFDLHNIVKALHFDTLLVSKEWSLYKTDFSMTSGAYIHATSMRAFTKPSWNKSEDLLLSLPLRSGSGYDIPNNNGICVYKGSPSFGEKRLSFDSADYFLHCPGFNNPGDFSETAWPGTPVNCGDITGSGNNVLGTRGGVFTNGFSALYVLGKAMDDKIDVFMAQNGGGYGGADSIHISSSGAPTYILDAPAYESPEDQNKGIFQKGSLEVLQGTSRIPVHLNPKFAVTEIGQMIRTIEIFPNPIVRAFNVTAIFREAENIKLVLRDLLGRAVYSESRFVSGGKETIHINLPQLVPGTYFLEIAGRSDRYTAKISVLE